MFESDEQKKRAELIITLLAKLYVVLELSGDHCPVCHKALDSRFRMSDFPRLVTAQLKNNNATPARPSAPLPSPSAPTNHKPTRWSTDYPPSLGYD